MAIDISKEPIDIVYTWVNGDDDAYIEKCKEVAKDIKDVNPERFRDVFDMIKFSLRSVELYVPWIRNIYIFSQSHQIPDWLNTDNPRVKIVHHEDVFDPQYTPTYNSNVIESHIGKIPELSEYFLYMNDDFLFGKPTEKEKFVSKSGIINVFGSMFGENLSWRIYEKKNDIIGLGLVEHCPLFMKKEYWEAMYALWPSKTHQMRLRKFRGGNDFMAHKIYRYYMLKEQRDNCRPMGVFELKKIQSFHKITNNFSKQKRAFDKLTRVPPYFYCLNDDQGKDPNKDVIQLVKEYLKSSYPAKSSFEK
jgi:hypothetical protein